MSILKLKDGQGNWVGIPTVKGDDGKGISSTTLNSDYTLTLTFTDGTTYTTPSIRGEKGEQGDPATSMEIHICSSSEYDSQTRIPTIAQPDSKTFYLVPTSDATSPDLFTEWVYVNNAWEMFGSASVDLSGYLTDVTVNGTSVVTDGVANIPIAGTSGQKGVISIANPFFIEGSALLLMRASSDRIKNGTDNIYPLVSSKQHESVFYGLAKAAGHDEKDSTLSVGQYTDEAKSAIQNMLGIDFHYLTPEMYGAVGDGTTDDSVALQNCINDAITQELPVRGFNIYATTQPINIVAKYLNVYIHEIIYSGNDVGVILTGRYNNINIDEIDAYDSTGCGFRLTTTSEREAIYNEIHIGYIAAYGNGIEYLNPYGESQGLYYNRLYINQLYSRNANCIYINTTNRQCGENSFWGKHVTNNNGYFVYCENSGNNPSNKFYEFCIESSSKNGVYGQATLINCRTVECMDRRKPDNNEGNIFTFNGVLPMGKAINTPLDYLCVDVSNASTYADRLAIIKTQLEGGETKAYAFDAAFPQEMSYVIGEGFRLWDYYSVTDSALGNNSPTGKVIAYYNHKGFIPDYDWYHKIEVNEYYTLTTDHVVPTIFNIDTNTTIHLDDSYCPVGINKFKVIQYDDKKAVIYDHNNNLVFDGQNYGAGTYEIECHMTSHTFEIIANSETFTYGDTATRGKYFGINEAWDVEAVIDSMPDVPVEDVQINGTSIVSDGTANIPIASSSAGVVKIDSNNGVTIGADGKLYISSAIDLQVKRGEGGYRPITPPLQHKSAFYGLAKAAGDTTQSASSNAVGNYTDNAKDKIQTMLGVSPLIAPHESDPFDSAHVIGELFIINGKLYRAKTALTAGEYINEGTNVEVVNVAEVLDEKVNDVQIDGTSIVVNEIANIPIASSGKKGIVQIQPNFGININSVGDLYINSATPEEYKNGSSMYKPTVPNNQHLSTFYGLAKVAGHDEKNSTLPVGTYTDEAKSAISNMLNGAVQVSGTDPTITAKSGIRYVCGEVLSLNFTPSANGICDVMFTSGSTPTVLTLPNTVKMPEWFIIEANTTYEINIADGIYGAVTSWTL